MKPSSKTNRTPILRQDHHVARHGGDYRGLPKKGGAGDHNWGVPGDASGEEITEEQEQNASKIQTVDSAKFELAKSAK
ncbi:hypothetical protein BB558_005325 [Smittium angustum]|uniref:Hyaluronan/mRNA-binding protein domain-containing protein n=1 Tax=Smittium angustum TaxID=133377 RepID=A0A2U1J0R6_SMIAN|nr:hypothetical protein BB558_005325 [Smittium angustum]